tara:strand:+ start:21696 stop:23096 length:1401 start_codon:yes stop_codon:yes gene_type:complete
MIFAIPLSFFIGAACCILAGTKINVKKIAITFTFVNLVLCFHGDFVNTLLAKGSYGLGGWMPPYGIEFFAEPVGLTFVCLVSMIGFFGLIYAGSISSKKKGDNLFFALTLFLLGALQAICLSGDLFNIYVWLELSSICAFAIMGYKTKKGAFATFNYLLAAGVAGVIFLLGTGLIYGSSGTLNLDQISTLVQSGQSISSGFTLIIASLLIKMALTPFHFWLPNAYGNIPIKTLGVIPAIVTKAPAIVLFKIALQLKQNQTNWFAFEFLLPLMGAGAVLYGSLMAVKQIKLKKILAYSSIAQLGLVAIGIGILDIQGTLIQIIAHSIVKFSLFCSVGALERFANIKTIDELKLAFQKSPILSWVFILCGFSLAGIPPFAGFFAKYYLVVSSLGKDNFFIVFVILSSSLLTAGYFLKILESIVFAKHIKKPEPRIPITIYFPIIFNCSLTIVFGIFLPKLLNILEGLR